MPLVSNRLHGMVQGRLADSRDGPGLALEAQQVSGLEIATREETLAVERVDGKGKLTRPMPLPADTETVTEFLDKLQSSKTKEFVAEGPQSLDAFGLARPLRLSIHTGKDKDRVTRSLLIGGVDKAKQGVYAMRPGERAGLVVAEQTGAM